MSFSTNEPLLTKKLCPNLAMSAAPNTDRGGIYHGEAQAIWIRTAGPLNEEQQKHLAELGIRLSQEQPAFSRAASVVYTAELSPGANLKAFLALPEILQVRAGIELKPLGDRSPDRLALQDLKLPSGEPFRGIAVLNAAGIRSVCVEPDSKGSSEWSKMVNSAHFDRWVGFTFNPTPLDLVSNSHIRSVGRVVDALYSAEFRKMVSPLNGLYPVLSDVSSNLVAVLARTIRETTRFDMHDMTSFIATLEGQLQDYITAAPQLDAARKSSLCNKIESVMHDVRSFISDAIQEANAFLAEEKRIGVSCIPGEPSMNDLHKLYYPKQEKVSSPWQRLASGAERRPINAESADVVGAPRDDVPVVEHVYAQDEFDAGVA